MSQGLYMDVHVPMTITKALRRRGFDVLRAQDDGAERFPDPQLLDRADELKRILFTQDEDFLVEASRRMEAGERFATVVYAHQFTAIGQCVNDLALLLEAITPDEAQGQLVYLPL